MVDARPDNKSMRCHHRQSKAESLGRHGRVRQQSRQQNASSMDRRQSLSVRESDEPLSTEQTRQQHCRLLQVIFRATRLPRISRGCTAAQAPQTLCQEARG